MVSEGYVLTALHVVQGRSSLLVGPNAANLASMLGSKEQLFAISVVVLSAKLAKRMTERQGKKVLMASLDNRRPAAKEQLRVLGELARDLAADRPRRPVRPRSCPSRTAESMPSGNGSAQPDRKSVV